MRKDRGWRHLRTETVQRARRLSVASWLKGFVLVLPFLAVFALMGRGCHSADVPSLHAPKEAAAIVTTTTVVDLTHVLLPPVEGTTTTMPAVQSGRSTIDGNVTSPQGAVPGAIVRIERIVDGAQATDIATDENGHYSLAGIAGGRYRVRAFLPPLLAQPNAEVFFMADGDHHTVDLSLQPFTGIAVAYAIAPAQPTLDQQFTVAVRVGSRVVDNDGLVHTAPLAGAPVTLSGPSSMPVQAPSSGITDANGTVSFTVTCKSTSAVQLTATARAPGSVTPGPGSTTTTTSASSSSSSSSSSGPPTTAASLPEVQTLTIDVPVCVAPTTTTSSSSSSSGDSATTTTAAPN